MRSCALTTVLALSVTLAGAGASRRVAVYAGNGAASEAVVALFRGLAALGHEPRAIVAFDVAHGRLTSEHFDLLVLPAGQDGGSQQYAQDLTGLEPAIRSFVAAGGGFVGIEAGARYAAENETWYGLTFDRALDLYAGSAIGPLAEIGDGMGQIRVVDVSFGEGDRTVRYRPGASYFTVPSGAAVICGIRLGGGAGIDGFAAVVRAGFGAGRVVLIAPSLEFEEDGERDWTVWDNVDAAGYEVESDWPLLGRLVEWAAGGTAAEGNLPSTAASAGRRFALYARRDADGGAWPGLLPAVARSIEFAGHVPLAVRDDEIRAGLLSPDRFDVLLMPGGWAYGYVRQLDGFETVIRGFLDGGGGYVGISAGSFYGADRIIWRPDDPTTPVDYPLDLYSGIVEGDIADIAPWPSWEVTPVAFSDPVLGNGTRSGLYWGEGFYHEDGSPPLIVSGRLAYGGADSGAAVVVRHSFGAAGRVFSPNLHFEAEEGSGRDWAFFDDWQYDSATPQVDPESDWEMLADGFDWVAGVGGAQPFAFPGAHLGIRKTPADDTGESLADGQRRDATGAAPSASITGDGWYRVGPGGTMELTGFGEREYGPLLGVVLRVQYSVDAAASSDTAVEWSVDGAVYEGTSIRPRAGDLDVAATYDLAGAGVDSWGALSTLRIRYRNNGSSGGTAFDHVHVVPAYLPAEVSPPGSSDPLRFSSATGLQWEEGGRSGSTGFDILRGSIAGLAAGDFGACLLAGLRRNTANDAAVPAPGSGFTYLVRGQNDRGDGTPGNGSAGEPRVAPSCP